MNRIFLTLAIASNVGLMVTFMLGWTVISPGTEGASGLPLSVHFLCALAALTLTLLVHAIVLTYFMGTGRWIEETSEAYRLGVEFRQENVQLKYRTLPGMVACLVMLIVTGALGAAADPGAAVGMPSAKVMHTILACVSLLGNVLVSVIEYQTIQRNGRLVDEIMSAVRAIRLERGLDHPAAAE